MWAYVSWFFYYYFIIIFYIVLLRIILLRIFDLSNRLQYYKYLNKLRCNKEFL